MPKRKSDAEPVPAPDPALLGVIDEHLEEIVGGGLRAAEEREIAESQQDDVSESDEDCKSHNGNEERKSADAELRSHAHARVRAQKNVFVRVMAQTGTVTLGCVKAQISRQAAYRWRAKDPQFSRRWDEALDSFLDLIEARGSQLAVEGVLEPVFHEGVIVGHVRKFDGKMIQFMLERRRRSVYRRELALEHSGSIAAELTPDDVRAQVLAILPTVTALCAAAIAGPKPMTIDVRSDA